MLELKQITLISINCVDPIESVKAINYSRKDINFGPAFLFTDQYIKAPNIETISIPKLKSVDEYNDFVLMLAAFNLPGEYFLILQDDGFVTSAKNWDNDFLLYDFIGAPWPNDPKWIEKQRLRHYVNFVGNGGFSLRSKKFLELSHCAESCQGFGEDIFLTNINYNYMKAMGIKFAPVEVAERFSRENNLSDWTNPGVHDINSSFGFHGKNFSNFAELINLKNNI